MTPSAGAGAAVAVGRSAHGIEVGQDVDISGATIMACAIVAGPAVRVY